MDDIRFDFLTRHLSTTGSRRGAFRTIGAAGLGLGLLRLSVGDTLAKHHKHKHKKKKKNNGPPPPPPPTQNLGDTCSSAEQCIGGLQCQVSNSQNSCFDSSVQRCCVADGGRCDNSCDCCGIDVICNGHYCQGA
jgi:hypothetical protein